MLTESLGCTTWVRNDLLRQQARSCLSWQYDVYGPARIEATTPPMSDSGVLASEK
jgi:hypothetical protein